MMYLSENSRSLLLHLQVYLQMKVLVEAVYLVLICSLRG